MMLNSGHWPMLYVTEINMEIYVGEESLDIAALALFLTTYLALDDGICENRKYSSMLTLIA